MSQASLRRRFASGEPLYTSWMALPGALQADVVSRSAFEAMTIDMQHGLMGFSEMVALVNVSLSHQKPVLLRVPLEGWGLIGRALDVGVQGIIMPMVNSTADAERLVRMTKYPPEGTRSWGSYASVSYPEFSPADYLKNANAISMAFAMVETREALDAVDAICATPGLDGVFVGPSDLSISLSGGRSNDSQVKETQDALKAILNAAKKARIVAGIYCGGAELAQRYAGMGFSYLPIGSDANYLASGIGTFLTGIRQG